jgi:hypothetical protein
VNTTLVVTILLALFGYLATYVYNLRLAQRKDRLDRVNRQLGELYGPMLGMTRASEIAWNAFRQRYRPNEKSFWGGKSPPSKEEALIYRIWFSHVFMPINSRIYELILTKSDLLIESDINDSLLQFCAHVAAYQAVLKRWESNDFTENTSLVHHPREALSKYLHESFRSLKEEQDTLTNRARLKQRSRRVGKRRQ